MERRGNALYVGISRWPLNAAAVAYRYLRERDVPCLVYQGRYNMFDREVEGSGILAQAAAEGAGFVAFSPLAQGLLTSRYLDGRIPAGSRASQGRFLKAADLSPALLTCLNELNAIAKRRGQTLAQMALAWVLKDPKVTSVIVGSSSVAQLADSLRSLDNVGFGDEELSECERIISDFQGTR